MGARPADEARPPPVPGEERGSVPCQVAHSVNHRLEATSMEEL